MERVESLSYYKNLKMCLFKKYATFEGRATRGEYWKYVIITWLLGILLSFSFVFLPCTNVGIFAHKNVKIVTRAIKMLLLLPDTSVTSRRLHDIDRSAKFYLIYVVISNVIDMGFYFIPANDMMDYVESSLSNPMGLFVKLVLIINVLIRFYIFILSLKKGTSGENRFGMEADYSEYQNI